MAIATADLLLVNRAGTDYKMASNLAMTKVQATDVLLINRAGVDYKITGAKFLAGNFLDTDLFLVNRGGVDYKATGALMRAILQRAAVIGTVVLSEEDAAAPAFTSQKFKTTITLTDAGQPAATIGLKAYVQGRLKATLTSTNAITAIAETKPTDGWSKAAEPIPGNYNLNPSKGVMFKGKWYFGGGGESIFSSPDGITWSRQTDSSKFSNIVQGLATDGNILVGLSSGGKGAWSPDGTTWTEITGLNDQCNDLAYNPTSKIWHAIYSQPSGRFVIYRSTDGKHWTKTGTRHASTETGYCMTCANGVWVAAGTKGNAITSTDDGVSWAEIQIPGWSGGGAIYTIAYRNGLWLAGGDGRTFARSTDGLNWTAGPTISADCSAVRELVSLWGGWVAIVASTSGEYKTSLDGTTWGATVNVDPSLPFSASRVLTDGSRVVVISSRYYSYNDAAFGATRLTIAGCQTDGFARTDVVSSTPGSATGMIGALDDTNVQISPPSSAWAIGQKLRATKVSDGARLYLVFNAAGAVTDMQSADPGFVTMTNSVAPELTFPATFPSGNAPDVELPNGTTITTVVEAKNTAGAPTKTSNTVTPAR
jgi:hypothetical protein